MSNEDFLKDYIFYGADPDGMTSNHNEILKYLYGDDPEMDSFANHTVQMPNGRLLPWRI